MHPIVPRAATVGLFGVLAFCAPVAQAASILTKVDSLGALAQPYTTNYGSSFTAGQISPTDTFYEDYRFTIDAGQFSSISATFDLPPVFAISNLSARLLIDSDPAAAIKTPWTLPSSVVLQKWSSTLLTSQGAAGTVQVINPYSLDAGSYIFEVRGQVTGAAGGSYAGVFNIASVPEPTGLLMAFAGLGMLVVFGRRHAR